MTLSKLDEGIVKINSKVLESSELKKFDKLEKEGITSNGSVLKGKVSGYILITYYLPQIVSSTLSFVRTLRFLLRVLFI